MNHAERRRAERLQRFGPSAEPSTTQIIQDSQTRNQNAVLYEAIKQDWIATAFPIHLTLDELKTIEQHRKLTPAEKAVTYIIGWMSSKDPDLQQKGMRLYISMLEKNLRIEKNKAKLPAGPVPKNCVGEDEIRPDESMSLDLACDDEPVVTRYRLRLPDNGRIRV